MHLPCIIFGKKVTQDSKLRKIMAIRVHQISRETGGHQRVSSIANPVKKLFHAPPDIVISDDKIKAWLMSEDPENGMFFFDVYKGNEPILPSLQKAKKFEGHHHISSLLVDAADITAKPSLHQESIEDLKRMVREMDGAVPRKISKSSLERDLKSRIYKKVRNEVKPRLFCLTTYRCILNQGKMEWHQYFVPFTKDSFCDQPWIEKHKKKWVTIDGDLLIHRAEKGVSGEQEEEVKTVAKPKTSEYFCMRIAYFMIMLANKLFAFLLGNRSLPVEKKPVEKKSSGRGGYSVVLITTNKRIPQKIADPKSSQYLLMRIVYFMIAVAKKFFSFFLKNKPQKMGPEVSPNPGILMADEEKVRSYYSAKPSRPLPLFADLRKTIERKIIASRKVTPELTPASTSNHSEPPPSIPMAPINLELAQPSTSTQAEVLPPIPVQAPIEVKFETFGADQDEDLAF